MFKRKFEPDHNRTETVVYSTWSDYEQRVRGAVFKKPGAPGDSKTPIGRKRAFADLEKDENQCVVAYADGMCKNGRWGRPIAGIGVYWERCDRRNLAERCPGEQTSNRASLIAIVRALETMPVDIPKMIIKTDSKYSIGCVQQWLPKWRVNGFLTSKGDPVKNASVIKYLSALLQERRARGLEVSLEYVESHSGHVGNDRATAQANVGAKLQPQQDPDWGSLEARTTVIIENLAHAAMSRGPASKTETSDERPTKIRRTSDSVTFIGSSTAAAVINKPPNTSHMISILPTRPPDPPFRSPTVSINLKPTIHDLPAVPIVASLPVATRLQTPPPGPTAPRTTNIHNRSPPSQSICPQPIQIQKPPKPPGSPLKASKVLPPLVPVSASEIDFDMYRDCLLEGEEWEREIENL